MTRASLAGAKWAWDGGHLTVCLVANGKAGVEAQIPAVVKTLQQRFAAEVTISVEANHDLTGAELSKAMEKLREQGVRVESGRVGAHMEIRMTASGPITILMDTDQMKKKGGAQ